MEIPVQTGRAHSVAVPGKNETGSDVFPSFPTRRGRARTKTN